MAGWRSKQIRSSSRGQWSLDLRVLLDSLVGFHSLDLHKLRDNDSSTQDDILIIDHSVYFLISQVER